MKKYKIKASYTQWIELEVLAADEDEAYNTADDTDLEEWKEYDINDFYIHDIIYLGTQDEAKNL